MARFYIDSSLGILEMTATSEVRVNEVSQVSQHPLESGIEAADHIINNNRVISFNGIISNIRRISAQEEENPQLDNQRDVADFLDLLTEIRDSKELFTVHYDEEQAPAENCFFTTVDYNSNKNLHRAYRLSLSFEQFRISERARLIEIPQQQNGDLNAASSVFSNNTTQNQPSPPDTSFLVSVLGG